MRASPIRTRSDGVGRRFAGRLLALLALFVLVLPGAPVSAAHADTHLHAATQVSAGALLSEPDSRDDCALHPCHACGCHAVATVAEAGSPALPQPGLRAPRPAADLGEPRATAPPRRPPRA